MYLKSITLKGFKSFPDRTSLEFGPGVSVIVGPNGSGKSNVTDAVLWALGEQSPLAVRGQSMQDVIFGGAPGRQAARGAEVELVLDDSDGALGLGLPEVSVIRRLDRGGDGEYRLAGARCRLVDVIELLSDTGLGKEMHSVISQGRVEAIVTSKPRDRRLLIEEAAGLGKHRKRRRRAQLKLERTQENLDRALDVEREARSALRPLKRQAEAAELHSRLERQTLEVRWELARDELRDVRLALAEAERAAATARAKREHAEQALHDVARRREQAEEALAGHSSQREELSRRSFTARSAIERIEYRAESIGAQAEAAAARAKHAQARLTALEQEPDSELPDRRSHDRIASLEAELAALERDREAELARAIAELEQGQGMAARERERRQAAVLEAEEARKAAEERLGIARRRLADAERQVADARREAARVGGELAAVNQFLQSHEPSHGHGPALADELEVDPGYELALAAALDGRLGAIVVPDRSAAAAVLDRAGRQGGRVLLAFDGPRPESGSGAPAPAPSASRITDHVRGPEPAVALARELLADTWVVDSLDQLPGDFAASAVTRGGRVWSPGARELRQAPAVGDDRVLAERNRRERLIGATETAANAEAEAKAALASASTLLAELEETAQGALSAYRQAVLDRDDAAEEEARFARLIDVRRQASAETPAGERRARVLAELEAERDLVARAQRGREERDRRVELLRTELARSKAAAPALERLLGALSLAVGAIERQRDRFDAELAADREAGEHMAAELRACAQEETTLQSSLHAENEALTLAEVEAQRVRDRAADTEGELSQLAIRLELAPEPRSEPLSAEQRETLITRHERLLRRREQLGPVNPLAQQQHVEAAAHVEELERQRSDLEHALSELQQLIGDTDRQIRETFERTYEAAARNFEELVSQLFPGGSGRLRLIAEQGGPARVLGGQEPAGTDEEEGESPEDADGEESLGVEIEVTPAGKSMKRLSLLSGGEKSMTALAFLFAVFLARPCPFYILDEVEAALDDLNIDRFLELLRQYSARAQFIVVTHQKRTMEAADSLYGVSMGSDGISKVISRRLPREAAA